MELWKEIPKYEKRYSASTFGRIKSLTKKVKSPNGYRTVNERIMKPTILKTGYYQIEFGYRGKREFVHRLILKTFIGQPKVNEVTNHKNGIKTDNRLENLEWCTRSENQKHAYRLGLQKPTQHLGKDSPRAKRVYRFDLDGNFIDYEDCVCDMARKIKAHPGSLYHILNGIGNTLKNCKFSYKKILR